MIYDRKKFLLIKLHGKNASSQHSFKERAKKKFQKVEGKPVANKRNSKKL